MPITNLTGDGSYLSGGFVYSPYIPLQVTPTVLLDDFLVRTPQNSPLEDLVEGVYAEEIESGELLPVRKKPAHRRYKQMALDPDFYQTVTITNL